MDIPNHILIENRSGNLTIINHSREHQLLNILLYSFGSFLFFLGTILQSSNINGGQRLNELIESFSLSSISVINIVISLAIMIVSYYVIVFTFKLDRTGSFSNLQLLPQNITNLSFMIFIVILFSNSLIFKVPVFLLTTSTYLLGFAIILSRISSSKQYTETNISTINNSTKAITKTNYAGLGFSDTITKKFSTNNNDAIQFSIQKRVKNVTMMKSMITNLKDYFSYLSLNEFRIISEGSSIILNDNIKQEYIVYLISEDIVSGSQIDDKKLVFGIGIASFLNRNQLLNFYRILKSHCPIEFCEIII